MTIEVLRHAANEKLIRVRGLKIIPMPECEGGGYALTGDVAEQLVASLPQPVATQDTERRIREICEHYGASLSGAIARDVCALLVQPVAMGEEK